MHSTHTSGNTGHCKLSSSVNTAGTNILLLLLAARGESPLGENAHMCTRTHTENTTGPATGLGSLAVCPPAGICPASSTGHTSPRGPTPGAGTQDPLTSMQTLNYRALWDVALDPLPSSWSPEPPVTSRTNTHTNGGPSQTPESLQHLAWTASSSSSHADAQFFSALHGHFQVSSPTPSPGFIVFSHCTPHTPHHLTLPRGPL